VLKHREDLDAAPYAAAREGNHLPASRTHIYEWGGARARRQLPFPQLLARARFERAQIRFESGTDEDDTRLRYRSAWRQQ
jgi:hypothetical protein